MAEKTMNRIFNRVKEGGRNANVGKVERWASVLGGAALAAYALKRRGKGGLGLALAGAPLLWRGATGHCSVYEKMGIDRVHGSQREGRLETAPSSREAPSTQPLSSDTAVHGNEREYLGTNSGAMRPASEQF